MNRVWLSEDHGTASKVPNQVSSTTVLCSLQSLIESLDWPAGVTPTGIRLSRVWAGRNQRISIEHRVTIRTDDGLLEVPLQGVIATTVPRRCQPKSRIRISNGVVTGALGVDREIALSPFSRGACWVASPDCDPEMSAARQFFQLRNSQRPRLAASMPFLIAAMPSLISYRIGRRFVARYGNPDAEQAGWYVKGFRRQPDLPLIRRSNELARLVEQRSEGHIRVPSLLAILPQERLLVFAEVWPRPVPMTYDAIDLGVVARTAALIHGLPTCDERTHSVDDEIYTVSRWRDVLETLGLNAVKALDEILPRIRAARPLDGSDSTRMIHRDFYHAQVLRNCRAIWLVDWDTLCRGHAELDIATYAAHALLQDSLTADPASDWSYRLKVLLEAYRAAGGTVESTRLRWYLACALSRLAAMHTARGYPDAALAPLWSLARALVDNPRECRDWMGE